MGLLALVLLVFLVALVVLETLMVLMAHAVRLILEVPDNLLVLEALVAQVALEILVDLRVHKKADQKALVTDQEVLEASLVDVVVSSSRSWSSMLWL